MASVLIRGQGSLDKAPSTRIVARSREEDAFGNVPDRAPVTGSPVTWAPVTAALVRRTPVSRWIPLASPIGIPPKRGICDFECDFKSVECDFKRVECDFKAPLPHRGWPRRPTAGR
eukprot:CAMPEP_0184284340 /NCGR_PEP_ID=MMETSP0977-20130417/66127_1 /TAXON_ID=483370 /ORGANISM="non described non described, Strain CCMP2097" /LENGTH=115 /DNA_ID=CAMNT_0026590351 /DNA_START=824 /DNA_END=1168 /DNA_ORIENTATION=-